MTTDLPDFWNPEFFSKIESSFVIHCRDEDPQQCTEAIGIEPTASGRAGTRGVLQHPRPLDSSFWKLAIEKKDDDTDSGMSELLDLLWDARDPIVQLLRSTGFGALFRSRVVIYEYRPLYSLSPETIQRISCFEVPYELEVEDYSSDD